MYPGKVGSQGQGYVELCAEGLEPEQEEGYAS